MNTRVEYDFARNLWRCCIYGDDWRWEFEITEQEVDVSSLPPPKMFLAADMARWRLERDAEIERERLRHLYTKRPWDSAYEWMKSEWIERIIVENPEPAHRL